MIPPTSAHQANYSKFVYFHPSTKGQVGRAVYIDPQLLVRFMELIDAADAKGQQVARGMIALQSTAAGTTSDSNKSCAFQHRQTIQNVVVTYSVLQNGGRGAGVYITDLQHGYSSDEGRPGLYKVTPNFEGRERWKANKEDGLSLSSLVGVLGALPPSEEGIVSPEATAGAFAEGPLKRERVSSGFSLFYTPTYVIDQMGVWLTSDQKRAGGTASSPQNLLRFLPVLPISQKVMAPKSVTSGTSSDRGPRYSSRPCRNINV